jgi:hypothetical protein
MWGSERWLGRIFASQGSLGARRPLYPVPKSALLPKFIDKLHSDTSPPSDLLFRRMYGSGRSRDLGDSHYLDTPVWRHIMSSLDPLDPFPKSQLATGLPLP